MIQELRKSVGRVTSSVDAIIVLSLWIGLLTSLLSGLVYFNPSSWLGLIPFVFAALYAAQLVTFERRSQVAWMLSALQTLSILHFSIATFGYILTYLFKSFSGFQPGQAYVLAALLLATEALKTVYFYRSCKR